MKTDFLVACIAALLACNGRVYCFGGEQELPAVSLSLPYVSENSSSAGSWISSAKIDEPWHFTLTPYTFFANLSGDTKVGIERPFHADYNGVLDFVNSSALLRMDVTKGRWGLTFDTMNVNVGLHDHLGSLRYGVDGEFRSVDLALNYRCLDLPNRTGDYQRLSIDVSAGLRYTHVALHTNNFRLGWLGPVDLRMGDSHSWVEPFFGAGLVLQLSEAFGLHFNADVGGFGIGSASKLTRNVWAGFEYAFSKTFSVVGGYRVWNIDYANGDLALDLQARGPWVGISVRF